MSIAEWSHRRWTLPVQEKHLFTFSGPGGMPDLLLVRGFRLLGCPLFSHTGRIINVTDASLPKKSCQTCKNRFHTLCLNKVTFLRRIPQSRKILTRAFISGSTLVIPQLVPFVVQLCPLSFRVV